ncbi:alanine--tRNA ligase [Phycisphaera mikurensis]|uniref:Alanine--tRNA ligase n=1 Tax=Phycisphaera mikurensis (strain NBRC 102666 / KCTC 22515 / FYK2301M01) TaxID=1142394 RepID=I0IDL8_PHYMF|nr:alanine--tRNA ligase [Phycisphaera mikurensis]MBB6441175.1 alanyl-tRNA synthetase [Phycisphaera mikurensis]BAM03356.1 alanyl-tRNA synthetase [Phycisphaera mikurensis NBRC 102666]
MPEPSAKDVRQQFLDFFAQKHGHKVVPSAPVVPHGDPTLLFANAGMNPFKPYFLGEEVATDKRVCDTQKCIRAGGKHNDLEDVGRDTYHHTFFEMLGNWSFGDYFKKEAIRWAWELLVDVWGLEPERLHATYFEGDEAEGLEPDLEARDLWLQLLPAERVHPGNKKDNFWEMGDTGPCGPCSELHYDGTADLSGAAKVNADDPDVIEIWNLVFIQFNRSTTGKLEPLPAKHVDTGMGFERIVRVLQGHSSNYDTDVFTPLFEAIREATGAGPYTGELEKPEDVAYRVIADHIRTLVFALADGAHCDKDGRGYVLRRILRRAVRYGRQTLGQEQPFFFELVPAVVANFGDAFPELRERADAVAAEIREEEESFSKTLGRGIQLFELSARRVEEAAGRGGGKTIAATDAFQLHDTYGFPLDLTELMAAERGMTVDAEGFDRLMGEARVRSRGGGDGGEAAAMASLREEVQRGFDAGWYAGTNFTGFETAEAPFQQNQIHVFRRQDDHWLSLTAGESATAGDAVAIVLKMSPFYAEMGGQVGDTGSIQLRTGGRVAVRDTQKVGAVHVHLGEVVSGEVATDPDVILAVAVDLERRRAIEANHTATHLLNRSLRDRVSDDVQQRGSLVEAERLRFDFNHGAALGDDELAAIEGDLAAAIAARRGVFSGNAPEAQARGIRGLRAVFGEKYPPVVRVVSVGEPVDKLLADPDNAAWEELSVELCGGTHAGNTADLGAFALVGQEAVGKGVRRVTAVTGEPAVAAREEAARLMKKLDAAAGLDPEAVAAQLDGLTKRVEAATLPLAERAATRAKLATLGEAVRKHRKEAGAQATDAVLDAARAAAEGVADGAVLVTGIDGADGKSLRVAMDVVNKLRPQSPAMLAATEDGKVSLIASVPKDKVQAGWKAGEWVNAAAAEVGGRGGGKPDRAQAGGKDPAKLPAALDAARAWTADRG